MVFRRIATAAAAAAIGCALVMTPPVSAAQADPLDCTLDFKVIGDPQGVSATCTGEPFRAVATCKRATSSGTYETYGRPVDSGDTSTAYCRRGDKVVGGGGEPLQA